MLKNSEKVFKAKSKVEHFTWTLSFGLIYLAIRLLVVWGRKSEDRNVALFWIILLGIVWLGMILVPVINHLRKNGLKKKF
jgi:hypothetical protein